MTFSRIKNLLLPNEFWQQDYPDSAFEGTVWSEHEKLAIGGCSFCFVYNLSLGIYLAVLMQSAWRVEIPYTYESLNTSTQITIPKDSGSVLFHIRFDDISVTYKEFASSKDKYLLYGTAPDPGEVASSMESLYIIRGDHFRDNPPKEWINEDGFFIKGNETSLVAGNYVRYRGNAEAPWIKKMLTAENVNTIREAAFPSPKEFQIGNPFPRPMGLNSFSMPFDTITFANEDSPNTLIDIDETDLIWNSDRQYVQDYMIPFHDKHSVHIPNREATSISWLRSTRMDATGTKSIEGTQNVPLERLMSWYRNDPVPRYLIGRIKQVPEGNYSITFTRADREWDEWGVRRTLLVSHLSEVGENNATIPGLMIFFSIIQLIFVIVLLVVKPAS